MPSLVRRTPTSIDGDDVFSTMIRRMFNDPSLSTTQPSFGTWVPSVDVAETANAILLTAEVPGIDEKAIHLSVDNNVLTVSGEKEQMRKESDEAHNYYVTERFFGAFQRSFALPRSVDVNGIKAECNKGVLTVTLPKLAEAKGRQIEVQAR